MGLNRDLLDFAKNWVKEAAAMQSPTAPYPNQMPPAPPAGAPPQPPATTGQPGQSLAPSKAQTAAQIVQQGGQQQQQGQQ